MEIPSWLSLVCKSLQRYASSLNADAVPWVSHSACRLRRIPGCIMHAIDADHVLISIMLSASEAIYQLSKSSTLFSFFQPFICAFDLASYHPFLLHTKQRQSSWHAFCFFPLCFCIFYESAYVSLTFFCLVFWGLLFEQRVLCLI